MEWRCLGEWRVRRRGRGRLWRQRARGSAERHLEQAQERSGGDLLHISLQTFEGRRQSGSQRLGIEDVPAIKDFQDGAHVALGNEPLISTMQCGLHEFAEAHGATVTPTEVTPTVT